MPESPSQDSIARINKLVDSYCKKSGTTTHPEQPVTEGVVLGLAANRDQLGRPLCPCRFYPDKKKEIKHRTWICPCDDMQIYKYCHCLLFVDKDGLPITEYLPDNHEGRQTYQIVKDPTPDMGRALSHRAEERELERQERGV